MGSAIGGILAPAIGVAILVLTFIILGEKALLVFGVVLIGNGISGLS